MLNTTNGGDHLCKDVKKRSNRDTRMLKETIVILSRYITDDNIIAIDGEILEDVAWDIVKNLKGFDLDHDV